MKPLLEIDDLVVRYPHRRGGAEPPPAVDGVTLRVREGEAVGLAGESGSGKTSTAMAVLGLAPITGGTVTVGDWEVHRFGGTVPPAYRRDVQVVWQDPYGSLTPRMTVGGMLAEPIRLHFGLRGPQLTARVEELLSQVNLPRESAQRYPHEFSGGQRQRVAIARAVSIRPRLIVLDEPVSALDVLTQSQILALLEELREATGVAYLLISHDLAVVRYLTERVVILHGGKVMEEGPVDQVCDAPRDAYTRTLVGSVLDPEVRAS
ncbi:ATP-binding cassette domain-containing protein [Streptosporangium sp. NPDC004631]